MMVPKGDSAGKSFNNELTLKRSQRVPLPYNLSSSVLVYLEEDFSGVSIAGGTHGEIEKLIFGKPDRQTMSSSSNTNGARKIWPTRPAFPGLFPDNLRKYKESLGGNGRVDTLKSVLPTN